MYSDALPARKPSIPKFPLGTLRITPNAIEQLSPAEMFPSLVRHTFGDWGELEREDREANERALQEGGRLVSRFRTEAGVPFYIITECDRSFTTVLLPEDYLSSSPLAQKSGVLCLVPHQSFALDPHTKPSGQGLRLVRLLGNRRRWL